MASHRAVIEPLSTRRLAAGFESKSSLRPSAVLFEADAEERVCAHCPHDRSWHFKELDGCIGISGVGCACPGWFEKSVEREIDEALERAFSPEVVVVERAADFVFDEEREAGVRFGVNS